LSNPALRFSSGHCGVGILALAVCRVDWRPKIIRHDRHFIGCNGNEVRATSDFKPMLVVASGRLCIYFYWL